MNQSLRVAHSFQPAPAVTVRRTRRMLVTALMSLALVGPAVYAHSEHGKPAHGGVTAEAGTFQGELVASGKTLTLWITEHGASVATAGASGRLTMLAGSSPVEVDLLPAGENRLSATLAAPIPAAAKVAASVKLKDGRAGVLRFQLK